MDEDRGGGRALSDSPWREAATAPELGAGARRLDAASADAREEAREEAVEAHAWRLDAPSADGREEAVEAHAWRLDAASADGREEAVEAHAWRLDAARANGREVALLASLDAEERDAHARLRFEATRRRYLAAHGLAREVLASYAGCAPSALRFERGPHGKPRLVAPEAAALLEHNLSHSGEVALLVVARGVAVGIDVEELRAVEHAEALARKHLGPEAAAALAGLAGAARDRAFLSLWTRHEAAIKARGGGVLVRETAPAPACDVRALAVDERHVAALAATSPLAGIVRLTWAPAAVS